MAARDDKHSIYHIVPVNDLRDHRASINCWCKPVEHDEEPDVWVHNSMDVREHTIELGKLQ